MRNDTAPTQVQPDADDAAARPSRARSILRSALWAAHWVLRIWLAGYLLIYGWSKVYLVQMGYADFSDALVQYGEMSPMGVLWRFMAFSPTVQVLAGLAEVLAAVLLLFRRTVWLGALLAAVDMSVVFLLNLTFDVPVKQLSGIMAVAGIVLLAPNLVRLGRFLLGLPTGRPVHGRISSHRIVVAVTKWTSPALALVLIIGSGVAFGLRANWGQPDPVPAVAGVYRATDSGSRTLEGAEISQVAFGQNAFDGRARLSIRYADGSFQDGGYTVSAADTGPDDSGQLDVTLFPKLEGDQGLVRDPVLETTLDYAIDSSGQVRLTGDGLDVTLVTDPERRYLFDREFSWEPSEPINR